MYTSSPFGDLDRSLTTETDHLRHCCDKSALTTRYVRQSGSLRTHPGVRPASGTAGPPQSSSRTRPESSNISALKPVVLALQPHPPGEQPPEPTDKAALPQHPYPPARSVPPRLLARAGQQWPKRLGSPVLVLLLAVGWSASVYAQSATYQVTFTGQWTTTANDQGKYLRATATYIDGEDSDKTAEEVSDTVVGERAPAPEITGTTLVSDLDIPWGVAFTPNGTMLFTERGGTLSSRVSGRGLSGEPRPELLSERHRHHFGLGVRGRSGRGRAWAPRAALRRVRDGAVRHPRPLWRRGQWVWVIVQLESAGRWGA